MNLPFQVVGNQSLTATLLLATTFATLAERGEEHLPLDTLVVDQYVKLCPCFRRFWGAELFGILL
jgi:hypothetical protein